MRIAKVLFDPADFDAADALRVATEDWARAQPAGAGALDAAAFARQIFELVDIWTETMEVAEYRAFLK